jgi:hypothetical protein
VPLPRLGQRRAERQEPLAGDRGQQGLFVGEVPVERGAGHAKTLAHRPQREGLHPMGLNGPGRLVDQGAAKIPMVVPIGRLPSPSSCSRGSHMRILTGYVDNVNTAGYGMLTLITLRHCEETT